MLIKDIFVHPFVQKHINKYEEGDKEYEFSSQSRVMGMIPPEEDDRYYLSQMRLDSSILENSGQQQEVVQEIMKTQALAKEDVQKVLLIQDAAGYARFKFLLTEAAIERRRQQKVEAVNGQQQQQQQQQQGKESPSQPADLSNSNFTEQYFSYQEGNPFAMTSPSRKRKSVSMSRDQDESLQEFDDSSVLKNLEAHLQKLHKLNNNSNNQEIEEPVIRHLMDQRVNFSTENSPDGDLESQEPYKFDSIRSSQMIHRPEFDSVRSTLFSPSQNFTQDQMLPSLAENKIEEKVAEEAQQSDSESVNPPLNPQNSQIQLMEAFNQVSFSKQETPKKMKSFKQGSGVPAIIRKSKPVTPIPQNILDHQRMERKRMEVSVPPVPNHSMQDAGPHLNLQEPHSLSIQQPPPNSQQINHKNQQQQLQEQQSQSQIQESSPITRIKTNISANISPKPKYAPLTMPSKSKPTAKRNIQLKAASPSRVVIGTSNQPNNNNNNHHNFDININNKESFQQKYQSGNSTGGASHPHQNSTSRSHNNIIENRRIESLQNSPSNDDNSHSRFSAAANKWFNKTQKLSSNSTSRLHKKPILNDPPQKASFVHNNDQKNIPPQSTNNGNNILRKSQAKNKNNNSFSKKKDTNISISTKITSKNVFQESRNPYPKNSVLTRKIEENKNNSTASHNQGGQQQPKNGNQSSNSNAISKGNSKVQEFTKAIQSHKNAQNEKRGGTSNYRKVRPFQNRSIDRFDSGGPSSKINNKSVENSSPKYGVKRKAVAISQHLVKKSGTGGDNKSMMPAPISVNDDAKYFSNQYPPQSVPNNIKSSSNTPKMMGNLIKKEIRKAIDMKGSQQNRQNRKVKTPLNRKSQTPKRIFTTSNLGGSSSMHENTQKIIGTSSQFQKQSQQSEAIPQNLKNSSSNLHSHQKWQAPPAHQSNLRRTFELRKTSGPATIKESRNRVLKGSTSKLQEIGRRGNEPTIQYTKKAHPIISKGSSSLIRDDHSLTLNSKMVSSGTSYENSKNSQISEGTKIFNTSQVSIMNREVSPKKLSSNIFKKKTPEKSRYRTSGMGLQINSFSGDENSQMKKQRRYLNKLMGGQSSEKAMNINIINQNTANNTNNNNQKDYSQSNFQERHEPQKYHQVPNRRQLFKTSKPAARSMSQNPENRNKRPSQEGGKAVTKRTETGGRGNLTMKTSQVIHPLTSTNGQTQGGDIGGYSNTGGIKRLQLNSKMYQNHQPAGMGQSQGGNNSSLKQIFFNQGSMSSNTTPKEPKRISYSKNQANSGQKDFSVNHLKSQIHNQPKTFSQNKATTNLIKSSIPKQNSQNTNNYPTIQVLNRATASSMINSTHEHKEERRAIKKLKLKNSNILINELEGQKQAHNSSWSNIKVSPRNEPNTRATIHATTKIPTHRVIKAGESRQMPKFENRRQSGKVETRMASKRRNLDLRASKMVYREERGNQNGNDNSNTGQRSFEGSVVRRYPHRTPSKNQQKPSKDDNLNSQVIIFILLFSYSILSN